jgi:major histocompatibility complex class I
MERYLGMEKGVKAVLKSLLGLGVVAHTFNPSTREAEAGGFLSSRPAWSTE